MQCSKPQFGQWLIDQVRSGRYEGLRWVDSNKIRIPWKHNSRKDCGDEDNRIFKAWAEASGKINENPTDKAKWKTNFRCALNILKQFKMVEDHSKESDDPHKVYEIVMNGYNYKDQNSQDFSMNVEYPFIQDIYITDHSISQDEMQEALSNDMLSLNLNNQPGDDSQWHVPYPITSDAEQGGYPSQAMTMEIQQIPPSQMPVVVQEPYCPVNQPEVCDVPPSPPYYNLEISICYRKKLMQSITTTSPRVQLHFRCEDQTLGAQSICLPSTEHILDRYQAQYTNRILSSIERGLLLEVRPTGIYGLRQDRCHVFACTGNPAEMPNPQPNKLPQSSEVELLSFEKFIRDLKEFQENKRGSPEYTIYLCFGEKFPDGKAVDKKLITVKVVPLACRDLHEKAHMDGASSLQGDAVSLQISHNSLFDLINSTFGLPIAFS
ncbi:interferon regulatory factor 7 isoform X2 [Paramormyrops kingsleyae]|uniref:Interferon regulatory factor 7 n=1 Tax=Paramormyrops kingsleyae TaxID=1676925 RepID=A0A3B3R1S5_9TELE|nr:interferon regulatory factor 7 isoform X2 [Paramormyrops kingsleyae]XP_023697786.1 interferon regulatory factor 7 isoform X2 [Paramormyrops kingsleyae]